MASRLKLLFQKFYSCYHAMDDQYGGLDSCLVNKIQLLCMFYLFQFTKFTFNKQQWATCKKQELLTFLEHLSSRKVYNGVHAVVFLCATVYTGIHVICLSATVYNGVNAVVIQCATVCNGVHHVFLCVTDYNGVHGVVFLCNILQ